MYLKKNNFLQPFLKWAGGKRQLLPELLCRVPKRMQTYYEPFVGGGALFFALQPKKAVINDFNRDLIHTYEVIRDDVDSLLQLLSSYKNDVNFYYKIRELDRNPRLFKKLSAVEKGARIIYLNKTCYNGLFRVNSAGEFNSPFGYYKNPNIINEAVLKAVSTYLNTADINLMCGDFSSAVKSAKKGDFVYFDPPYDPVSQSSNFTGYTSIGFDKEEQIRLKKLCDELNKRGVKFLLSNSATPFILDLYKDYHIDIIPAKRIINSNASLRGVVDEVLISNYET